MKRSYSADSMMGMQGSKEIARLKSGLQAYFRDTVGSVLDHGNEESHIDAFVSHKTYGHTGPQSIKCEVAWCLKKKKYKPQLKMYSVYSYIYPRAY